MKLSELKNTTRPKKKPKCIGRGPSSGHGKTCCRGNKGANSRSGAKDRGTYEGGQMRLFMKLPIRGFSRAMFAKEQFVINFTKINEWFDDGEVVNIKSLQEKGHAPKFVPGGLKVLSTGELVKKVTIEAHAFSEAAQKKCDEKKIPYKVIG